MMLQRCHNMSTPAAIRKQFQHLKRTPGPGAGWQSRAAKELGYSAPYISRLNRGLVTSPAASAALDAWKVKNGITAN
jgi:hypothetical protein